MDWRLLLSLVAICILGHYGPMVFVYFVVALISFSLGLLLSMEKSVLHKCFARRQCSISKGIPVVTAIMDAEGVPKPNIKMSPSPALDVVFNQIISYIIRDYIYSWYAPLTPDSVFPNELHRLLQRITANTAKKVSEVNWIPFLTEVLPGDVASHIRLYRSMLERQASCPGQDHVKLFFDCEVDAEKTICRESICTSPTQEQEHLRHLSDLFLFFILPFEEYRVPAIRYIARELLVSAVLVPVIDLLSDPDFVNRSVAWFAKDSAFTSEYFVQALKMSDSTEELEVVVKQINSFMDKLRGRDTGGDDDASVKAQLGSLEYVRKICTARLRQIKEGITEKPEHLLAYHLQPGMRLYDMPFKELMSTSVALVSFLDYLTSIDKHQLLRLYLNCMSFRENTRQMLYEDRAVSPVSELNALSTTDSALTDESLGKITADDSDPDGTDSNSLGYMTDSSSQLIDASSMDVDLLSPEHSWSPSSETSAFVGNPLLRTDESIELRKTTQIEDDLRSYGILLCNNLLKQLPPSVEPMVQQALRTLTSNPGPLDPEAFADVEAKLIELLSDAQCFGAFKRSPQYVQLLAELDLLKDPSEQLLPVGGAVPSDPPAITSTDSSASPKAVSLSPDQVNNTSPIKVARTPSPTKQSIKSSPTGSSSSSTNVIGSFFNSFKTSVTEHESIESKKHSDVAAVTSTSHLISPTLSVGPHAETYTAQIVRTEVMQDSYVMYTIKVTCTSMVSGHTDFWQTLRRFSHFAELHSMITDRCGRIPKLKLPPKNAFNNLNREFLTRRRRELNEYLSMLCDPEFLAAYPAVRSLVVSFLNPDSWERGRSHSRGVSAILNPLRTVGNVMKAMPDTLADGFNRILTGGSLLEPVVQGTRMISDNTPKRSASFDAGRGVLSGLDSAKVGYTLDPTSADDTPIDMLFLLVDEMFNLQQKSSFTRESNFVILRKIFQTFFGPRVNKMIIAKATELTSTHRLAEFVAYLRDSVWPPTDPTQPTTQPGERAKETKLRTRVLCRTMLLGSVSDDLAQFLGNETTRRGVFRAFRLLQEERFNRRFVHCLLESILCQLFRSHQAHWESLFEKQLCPTKTGRSCRAHVNVPPD